MKDVYEELTIATGVYLEVAERGWGFPGSFETEKAINDGWLKVEKIANKDRVVGLTRRHGMSLGNAETVQLASECGAELALADEAEVRELLEERGVRVRGCVGILIEAARREVIGTKEAKKAMGRLVETGYRISDNVLKEAYRLLGEEP